MRPDILLFNRHVESAEFQIGIEKGMWGIEDNNPERPTWPFVIIWVKAAPKSGCPMQYHFRFDLSGYPSQAPTACPWDFTNNQRLANDKWPKGGANITTVFNPNWNPSALYTPLDRVAQVGHAPWSTQHPELWWQSAFTIMNFLHFLHSRLNSKAYAG